MQALAFIPFQDKNSTWDRVSTADALDITFWLSGREKCFVILMVENLFKEERFAALSIFG